MRIMIRSKESVIIPILFLVLSWNTIQASAFHIPTFRSHNFPPASSSRNFVYLRNTISNDNEDRIIAEKVSTLGYSILLADSREKVLAIKLYRFGGPNVEEHMQSNPDLISQQDALRSLTPNFDDIGTQKVFYKDGVFGESVQFYALADDISAFVSTAVRDYENSQDSLIRNHGVLGSIEAVREYARKGDNTKQVLIELKNLSVHTNARRRGIGKALTEAVQEYARCQVSILEQQESQRYTGIVQLTVESDNINAMELYKDTGFVFDGSKVKDQLCKLTWSTEGKYSS